MLASRVVFMSALMLCVALVLVMVVMWSFLTTKTLFTLFLFFIMSGAVSIMAYNLSQTELEAQALKRRYERNPFTPADCEHVAGLYPQDERPLTPEQLRLHRAVQQRIWEEEA